MSGDARPTFGGISGSGVLVKLTLTWVDWGGRSGLECLVFLGNSMKTAGNRQSGPMGGNVAGGCAGRIGIGIIIIIEDQRKLP